MERRDRGLERLHEYPAAGLDRWAAVRPRARHRLRSPRRNSAVRICALRIHTLGPGDARDPRRGNRRAIARCESGGRAHACLCDLGRGHRLRWRAVRYAAGFHQPGVVPVLPLDHLRAAGSRRRARQSGRAAARRARRRAAAGNVVFAGRVPADVLWRSAAARALDRAGRDCRRSRRPVGACWAPRD